MNIRYGFQRLVLLGSAGYQRAELPLDDSVSLIAPNNRGKTSLINALQYLLIIDKRRMDFGAHDLEKSRRFYFPNNNAYILLETTLPGTGTVVLGCVGKGVSHEFEYFAYRGQLEVDDYRLDNGALVGQPQLKEQLAQHDKLVFNYSPGEFAELLYGGRNRRASHEPDFTVFRLEHRSDASAFQRVLTRTLKLDKLKSSEVKEYLLRIFRRDLPDAGIDFKQEWDKAFSEVNAERAQYLAAEQQVATIDRMEQRVDERLDLRGKLIDHRPRIEQGLRDWQDHFQHHRAGLIHQIQQLQDQEKKLFQRGQELATKKSELTQQIKELSQQDQQQQALEQRFALISGRGHLQQQMKAAQERLEAQITLVGQAASREPKQIENELKRNERTLNQCQRELTSLTDNLYRRLHAALDEDDLDKLNRVFSRETMTLSSDQFDLDETQLLALIRQSGPGRLALPGLTLTLDSLSPQHSQRSEDEIREEISALEQQQASLEKQLETARQMDQARARKEALEQELRAIEQDLKEFDELSRLREQSASRRKQGQECKQTLDQVSQELDQSAHHAEQLRAELAKVNNQLNQLETQHRSIEASRNQRGDDNEQFGYLAELPHHPWLVEPQWTLDQLAEKLSQYQRDCARLLKLDQELHSLLGELHQGGLSKYLYSGNEEDEIRHIIDFRHQLPQEAEALERKARSAVVHVTASLRELRDGLLSFKSRMREFNRLIGHRQLSDLKTFMIKPEDETHLVEAIERLISTAEQVESGETYNLFNQGSLLDDKQLDRAKQVLIDEGNARQGLKVADLFRLQFVVAKRDDAEESFDDIDSAASNGTVLMAKLVTGLAMLHLMQDKRHNVKTICYLDEALALDADNQKSLIDAAAEFGFALIFASPAPLTTARYCVPIQHHQGQNHISRKSWQILEPLGGTAP